MRDSLANTKMLVVEDDHYYFAFVNNLLRKLQAPHFEIIQADTLSKATDLFHSSSPDLVLMDLSLPDSNGLESLQSILSIAKGVPVLVLTADDKELQGLEAVRMGAQDYLVKHVVSKESLVRCIVYAIERKKNDDFRQRQSAIKDFIETLAHDLSIPMIGSASVIDELLADSTGSLSHSHKSLLSALKSSNSRQLMLVNKLIEIYKYESEGAPLHMESVSVQALISHIVRSTPNQTNNPIELIGAASHAMVQGDEIQGDENALSQLFFNLLDNAIKYSEKGSKITITIKTCLDEIQVQFHNFGERLPTQIESGKFQSFWVSIPGHRYVDRTGLGLYLCDRIVSLHKGKLTCASTNGGTIFTVHLPLLESRAPEATKGVIE